MMEPEERAVYLRQVIFGDADAAEASPLALAQSVRFKIAGVANATLIIYVLWQGSRKITRYNQEIENYYSNTEGKTFPEIRTLLAFFVVTSLTSFVMQAIGKHHFTDSTWMIFIPSLLFSTLLFTLGLVGQRHIFTAADFAQDIARSDTPEMNNKKQPNDLLGKIRELIETQELYRQPDIKISDIALLLHTNRTYISAAINREMNVSFSELMNNYRVEYAKRLISESIAEGHKFLKPDIKELSGFSSEDTFCRAFKAVTGKTPGKWFVEQSRKINLY